MQKSGLRYPDTDQSHFFAHDIDVIEVLDVLRKPIEKIRGRKQSMIATGQTRSGGYIKVIYSLDEDGAGIFVITVYNSLTSNYMRYVDGCAGETNEKRSQSIFKGAK